MSFAFCARARACVCSFAPSLVCARVRALLLLCALRRLNLRSNLLSGVALRPWLARPGVSRSLGTIEELYLGENPDLAFPLGADCAGRSQVLELALLLEV